MEKIKVILASGSPRRRDLLGKILTDFQVIPSSFDESKLNHADPIEFAKKASYEKAKDVAAKNFDALVIGADTIVVLDKKIFGKPNDLAHAKRMLRELAGKTHQVITGVTIFGRGRTLTAHEVTDVTFKSISGKDIDEYLKGSHVLDKAGAYAIQEIGDKFVSKIKGDRENVVGLPVKMLREMLRLFQ